MPRDDDQSLGDQQTYEGGAQPADSSDRSLGDQSTFGGGGESSLSDIGGLTGDADLGMEIADLSRYEVQETLGKGGMGEVQLATDTRLNRKVAIKRMLGDATKSQTAVKRFLTEAQAIAALNHFNIVQIHDYGRDKDGPFLIMEYVEGGSLLDKCREGAIPLEEAVDLTCQLCDGLSKAHDAGIIHRDIKPANILLTTDGLPKLTDFGLARQDTGESGMTLTGAVLGTPDFMSPEQRRDATLTDARSDQWSLAATVYQMVTGKSPKVIRMDTVPTALQPVLIKALEEEQDDRYRSLKDFRGALRASQRKEPRGLSELGAGECPQCHTANESSRKFCRECATSLQQDCLQCEESILVWDRICGECGANQPELLEARRTEMTELRDRADAARSAFDYQTASGLADQVLTECDSRFTDILSWADSFKTTMLAERQAQEQRVHDLESESRQHRAAFDYRAAIYALETVPETLRTPEMLRVLAQLRADQQESRELFVTISDRVRSRDLVGLLEQVDRAIELRGPREDLQNVRRRLLSRDQKLNQKADRDRAAQKELLDRVEKSLRSAQLKNAKTVLESITKPVFDPDRLQELRDSVSQQLERSSTLKPYVAPEADTESLSAAQVSEFLAVADAFLALSPDSDPMRRFQSRLRAVRADRSHRHTRRLMLYCGALVAVFLLVSSGAVWWFRSIQDSASLAIAVENQLWDDVLSQHPDHVTALIGRASARLNQSEPDLKGAFADLARAETLDARAKGLSSAQSHAFARRAVVNAASGEVRDAENDLKEARRLGAAQSLLTTAKRTLVSAYLNLGQDAVHRNDENGIFTACESVERLEPENQEVPGLRITGWRIRAQSQAATGDLTGALASYQAMDELDSGAADTSGEQAALHVKLGRLTAEQQDTDAAQTHFEAAVSLKDDAPGLPALATSLAELAIVAFGQDTSAENRDKAMAALRISESVNAKPATSMWNILPTLTNSVGMKFKILPGDTFTMGSDSGEYDEKPAHQVTLTKLFEIGVYEVTQEQYESVTGTNPSRFESPQNPVEQVNWQDALDFCRKLSMLPEEKSAGYVYRLPTEAEWEYACRAGTKTPFSFGDDLNVADDYMWHGNNSSGVTHVVGQKLPNPWGLYDLHGNVWEWCLDWHTHYPTSNMSQTNPRGPMRDDGFGKIARGGDHVDDNNQDRRLNVLSCRVTNRLFGDPEIMLPDIGFRVCRIHVTPLFTAAEKGDAEAQAQLGEMYRVGLGVPEDGAEAVKWYRMAAEQGHANAQYALGDMYAQVLNATEALKWFRMAAEQGHAVAQYELGWMYKVSQVSQPADPNASSADATTQQKTGRLTAELEISQQIKTQQLQLIVARTFLEARRVAEEDPDAAQSALKRGIGAVRAAEDINPDLRITLAKRILRVLADVKEQKELRLIRAQGGEGIQPVEHGRVPKDDAEEVKWFRMAAEQGHADTRYFLGLMYYVGEGVPEDDAEAVKWFRMAAEQGDAVAQHRLGVMYGLGLGVPEDDAEAVKWFRLAAEQGDAVAQHRLGVMYGLGLGVPEDDAEAVKWFRLAAEQELADAQYALGRMYDEGQGVPEDDAEAVKWFRLAAEQGDAVAQRNLGVMYYKGEGVSKDSVEALKWFHQAAEQGEVFAQRNLGNIYLIGDGVSKYHAKALKWYRMAAEQGLADAQLELGSMYALGLGVSKDNAEAVKWYRMAAEQGLADAQHALGFIMYNDGKGVPKDFVEAYAWLTLAADQKLNAENRKQLLGLMARIKDDLNLNQRDAARKLAAQLLEMVTARKQ